MTKIVKSTSGIWSGSVHLADPMTMPQVKAVEDVLNFAVEGDDKTKRVWFSMIDENMIPAIVACVEKWELENFPKDVTFETFPASPRVESHKLIKWLFGEIYKVYLGEIDIPNE